MLEDGLAHLHYNEAGAMFREAVIASELVDAGGGSGGSQNSPALSGIEAAKVGYGLRYLGTSSVLCRCSSLRTLRSAVNRLRQQAICS
ncbi:hypothetical protein MPTK1_5g13740 [Marchantia polymorpha subsp. ruderalis]|nr:hypothetical protein MARPO_0032s0064 [Marchantia polymorpha]BBN11656.1 hypothetical protein Mp_5g13740 [Marchantia polymorpha subsp. ruderalis]PTQ41871.1 hypothetical protein MARPO_0032s0064 [Marchantia polymorpha]PTQ41872.1 hypothetical protein MARPO_0032s0064 [Marchantia polymorpha]PTQ41873.1 hypothetical protein MARPO_0032s0064 [Marchantia polymorpha]|eukprot:PTQ41870.1 hypothetical protein MARPO_0032s0064 [Marchantia polymorpha]